MDADAAPVTVAIVDDDAIVRSALASYLQAGGFEVVHQATNGEEALSAILRRPVDVVIMDVRMPKMDGIRATAELRRLAPRTKILIITSFDEDEAVRDALSAGANGFLLKDTSPGGLTEAVRTVMRGSSVVSPGPITRLVQIAPTLRPPTPPAEVGLSPRELQILRLLCDAQTNTEIASELSLSESTVKSHVSAIMNKLQVSTRLKAVVRAHELGLIERP